VEFLYIVIRWIWRALLKAGQTLGLSQGQIQHLRVRANAFWAGFIEARVWVIRIAQRLLGAIGLSVSKTISRAHLVSLIQRVSPVSSPFPLVRVGGPLDGGYLLPDDLNGISACFSPGVALSATFEIGVAERSIPSYMVDYSVDGPPVANKMFHFEKLFLAAHTDGDKYIRLEDWVNANVADAGDLLLQMDIEGSEWSVLLDTPDQILKRFRIMVIEFHTLEEMMTSTLGVEMFSTVLDKLFRNFKIVHLHANNAAGVHRYKGQMIPRVLELTFLRSDRFSISTERFATLLPHPLDQPNMPNKKEIVLSEPWGTHDKNN
jgi:hypothetical protein